jgi:hypothetical protein
MADLKKKRASDAKYRAAHREELKMRRDDYRTRFPERKHADDAKYRAANSEKEKARGAKNRAKNFEKEKARKAKWNAEHPEAGRAYAHRRYVLIHGGIVENFTDLEIFERDSYICGLCDEDIDSSLRHPHRFAPSLDHILPVTKGGNHTRDNVQASHLICNMRKGNRV